ncbi:choice-of-anchor Q domain-containing protein [Dokdonella sp.]|uniref:choice-of-anchor Q domain-containing protein n=1 Tax=Dokdonella sp. TaxID=2291710 RepID=UPI001B19762B|nr:choice-of-anchor Q domain-containing protein [Dokdonella sp.]MBO9662722.1 hypothetical protein [Dokdonella sp.]
MTFTGSKHTRKTPLVAALAIALGASLAGASAVAAPAGAFDAERFVAVQREQRAAIERQFLLRHGPLPTAPDRPAGTVIVSNCDDSGPGSLREAFTQAVSGDVIDLTALSCSTISLTSGALISGVDYLTLNGPGADQLAIDAGGNDRAIALMGSAGKLTIDGLTVRNGSYVYDGPGTYASLAAGGCVLAEQYVTISNSVVNHCSASGKSVHGAAINATGATTLVNSIVSDATASAQADDLSATIVGGAIAGGAVYLTDTRVLGADVDAHTTTAYAGVFGGGVFGMYGVVLTGSTVSGVDVQVTAAKDAYAKGGGVGSPMTVIMDRSTVSGNRVQGTPGTGAGEQGVYFSAISGGGVYIASVPRTAPAPSSIVNSTISGNAAICDGEAGEYTRGGGGGLGTVARVPVLIANSTISGNSTNLKGGALYTRDFGALTLTNSTIAENRADFGAAIADNGTQFPYALSLTSSLVAANVAFGAGTPVQIETVHAIEGASNLIASANVALPAGTLTGDPLLGPLADNGGPTWTHALLAGSPAIDHGANPYTAEYDQRGEGYLREYGEAADIGAYEVQPLSDGIFADGFD